MAPPGSSKYVCLPNERRVGIFARYIPALPPTPATGGRGGLGGGVSVRGWVGYLVLRQPQNDPPPPPPPPVSKGLPRADVGIQPVV